MSKDSHPSGAHSEKSGSSSPHCPQQSVFLWSFFLMAEKIHPNVRHLPVPSHPVFLCCACSSMSVPSSHRVAQTGHNTQAAAPQVGGKITPPIFWVHICSQFSRLAVVFATTVHGELRFNLLSTRIPPCLFLSAAVTALPIL